MTRLRTTFVIIAVLLLAGVGVSASALAAPAAPRQQATTAVVPSGLVAQLTGTWYNELGSEMKLTAHANGNLTGQYFSAVGDAENFYVLQGRFDSAPPAGAGVSLAWTVTFFNATLNAHSTSAWSGQFFAGAQPQILVQWLLTSSTTLPNVWQSTNVGHDEFTHTPPTAAQVAQAKAHGAHSPVPQATPNK